MSYILEALKKSDQQRQRGVTPTLPAAPITVASPKRPLFMYYGVLAAVLLGIGITIGWLRPWQAEQPAPAAEPVAAQPPIPVPHQAAPAPLAAQELPAPNPAPAVQPAPVADAIKADIPVSAAIPGAAAPAPEVALEKPASPAGVTQEQEAIPKAGLPLAIQQEIPAMTVQLHAYSSIPGERLVSINFRMLREGEFLMQGLRLEQITPDGLIFDYKGYRFRQSAR